MKKQLGITLAMCLLVSTTALADDAVLGALLGGGAGALVGHSIGGRNATIIGGALGAATGAAIATSNSHGSRVIYTAPAAYMPPPVAYMPPPPPPVYVPTYSQQVYYAAPPVRIVQRSDYYIQDRYERGYRHHHRHERDWERDDRRRHWNDRY